MNIVHYMDTYCLMSCKDSGMSNTPVEILIVDSSGEDTQSILMTTQEATALAEQINQTISLLNSNQP